MRTRMSTSRCVWPRSKPETSLLLQCVRVCVCVCVCLVCPMVRMMLMVAWTRLGVWPGR